MWKDRVYTEHRRRVCGRIECVRSRGGECAGVRDVCFGEREKYCVREERICGCVGNVCFGEREKCVCVREREYQVSECVGVREREREKSESMEIECAIYI